LSEVHTALRFARYSACPSNLDINLQTSMPWRSSTMSKLIQWNSLSPSLDAPPIDICRR